MNSKEEQVRRRAVSRFLKGEGPDSICSSLGRSKAWLYKWVERHAGGNDLWYAELSRRPLTNPTHTPFEIEEIVEYVRLNLYNKGYFCGAQAIRWEMEEFGVRPLPSICTINRILARKGLINRRTGPYEPKGKVYPKLPADLPNQCHQADHVGPCYLKGPVRFYSLNAVDLATGRCGVSPALSKSGADIMAGMWSIWHRMGIPDNMQTDNAISFCGSTLYPRGMGPLIKLCLHSGVEPWFIPVAEPWRNGVVERFNGHYVQKFLNKVVMASADELSTGSLAFEQRHNSSYRYSKLGGRTPNTALALSIKKLRFPETEEMPVSFKKKPETGLYHAVRFIRSDLNLHLFGEKFPVPPELEYEYVVATVDVEKQKLKLSKEQKQVAEYEYKLR